MENNTVNAIESAILKCFYHFESNVIHIAYSGGVDSQVLLHATTQLIQAGKLDKKLVLCHIHHGLSKHADEWLNFSEQQSKHYKSGFLFEKVSLDKFEGEGVESKARNARYQALTAMTELDDIIATGHHQDDQAETFLLALKRGSGTSGLSAMQQVRNLAGRQLVRPLLSVTRNDIETYAKHFKLVWIEDESNQNNTFDRNFLRNDVLPLLENRWPAIKKTITRSAQHCNDAEALIFEITQEDFKEVSVKADELSLPVLLRLSNLRFNNVIRYFLAQHDCLMPTQVQLTELASQLRSAEDKTPALKFGNKWLRRYRESLFITPEYTDITDWCYTVDLSLITDENNLIIELPDKLGRISVSKQVNVGQNSCSNQQVVLLSKEHKITLTYKHDNPTCLPEFREKSRSLKKILQELGLPPWQRKRQLYLYQNNTLTALLGSFICQKVKEKIEKTSHCEFYTFEVKQ